jgi:hypothetical protein
VPDVVIDRLLRPEVVRIGLVVPAGARLREDPFTGRFRFYGPHRRGGRTLSWFEWDAAAIA